MAMVVMAVRLGFSLCNVEPTTAKHAIVVSEELAADGRGAPYRSEGICLVLRKGIEQGGSEHIAS